jgi:hypothetical protein
MPMVVHISIGILNSSMDRLHILAVNHIQDHNRTLGLTRDRSHIQPLTRRLHIQQQLHTQQREPRTNGSNFVFFFSFSFKVPKINF